jgi:hypothetical protein
VYWYPSTTYQVYDSSEYDIAPEYAGCTCMQFYTDENGVVYARVDPESEEGKAMDLNAGAFSSTSSSGSGSLATGGSSSFSSGFTSSTSSGSGTFVSGGDFNSMPSASPSPLQQFSASPSPA